MNIVMLNGQNHKGSSYHVGKMIIGKIKGDKNIIEYFFPKDLNHFCQGCYNCITDVTKCPYYSEKQKIIDDIDRADLVVITTPTYCLHMSAPLKAFFDLTFDYWMVHRPLKSMFSKRAIIISTSAGASTKKPINDVKDCLFYLGIPKIYKCGFKVQAMNFESIKPNIKNKIEIKTSKLASKINTSKKPCVSIKTKFMFKMMGMLHKNGWDSSPVEKEYWDKQGWLDKKRPWND